MILQKEFYVKGSDAGFVVEFEYEIYRSAKTYGPPESCYPAEGGEVDILQVWLASDTDMNDISGVLSQKVLDTLTDKCEVWAREQQSSGSFNYED